MSSTQGPWRRGRALALALVLAGCGTQAPTSVPGGATGGPPATSQPASGQPSSSVDALPTSEPIDTGPLPAPTLTTADDIVAAMSDPDQAPQVVVSMLQLLGIGLYEPDGSPIRVGTETSNADFYLFEPSARGLASMLRSRDDPEEQVSFRDFHAALAGAGYGGTAEQLAAAYADSYAAHPDATVSRLIAALGPVDVDATLSSFEAWLLLVDGFVRGNAATTALAMAGEGSRVAAAADGGWGVSRRLVQAAPSVPAATWAAIVAQLRAVLSSWRIVVTASPATIHEGHGGPGDTAQLTAHITGPMTALTSPFGGATVIPAPSGTAGLPVAWYADTPVSDHGALSDVESLADQGGEASVSFTTQQEAANGQGIEREVTGQIHAGYRRQELLLVLYGVWAQPYASYFQGFRRTYGFLRVGWHQKAEATIKIIWTDTYDGVADTITFLGDLTTAVPDPVSGGVMYTGTGTATGSRAGWKACNPGIDLVPSGTGPATFNGYLTGTGSIMIAAYADAGTALAGISTEPMEVPIVGGFAQADQPTVGDLCPHGSHGEMTVTMLSLPN